jgi:hypothetical protein
MATIRLWIMAHEVTKRATIIAFTLSPWKMRKYLLELEDARNRTIAEEMRRKIPPYGFANIWASFLLAVLVTSWAGWGWLAATDHREIMALRAELAKYRTETVVEHHVTILGKLEDGDFAFTSDEEPQGGAFRPCAADLANKLDVVGLLTESVHYTAEVAKWEERATCKSILRADLGFWFRDKNNNFTYARINQ